MKPALDRFPTRNTTMAGRRKLRTVWTSRMTSVSGCSRPWSSGGAAAGWLASTGGGDGETERGKGEFGSSLGGGSDGIVTSRGHQSVAQADGVVRIQSRDDQRRFVCTGGVQCQRSQTVRAFERTATKIDVLEAGERQQFDDAEPDAAARFQHLRVQAVAPGPIGARRIPVNDPAAARREQRPGEQNRKRILQNGKANEQAGDQRYRQQNTEADQTREPPQRDHTAV